MEGNARTLVLCVGNPDRGDDGAGRAIARRLEHDLPAGVELAETGGDAAALAAALEGTAAAVVVDACVSGRRAGRLWRFDAAAGPLPGARFRASTHGLGLAEGLELARALGSLPPRCVVWAVEGQCFDPGTALSAPVAAALESLAARVHATAAAFVADFDSLTPSETRSDSATSDERNRPHRASRDPEAAARHGSRQPNRAASRSGALSAGRTPSRPRG